MGNGILYAGDCREVMRSMPDKSVDIVLTDPPYGMDYESGWYRGGNPFGPIIGDEKYPVELMGEFFRIARKAVFVFCRWDNLAHLPKPKSFIVWAKNNHTAGDLKHAFGRKWEGIAFYPMEEHAFVTRPADVIQFPRVMRLTHPTEKPVGLLEILLRTNVCESVFDPFAGSGSTLQAATNLGKTFIGCEIDPRYVDLISKRLDILPTTLPIAA